MKTCLSQIKTCSIFSLITRFSFILVASLGLAACGGGGGDSGNLPATPGTDSSVAAKTTVISPGDPICAYGGVLVETGIDENSNGVLDANEVDASEKVCNGAPGAAGTNGSNGSNGVNGSNGLNALVNITNEGAGTNCASGGKRIDSGLDANSNGSLDAGEIASTDYICDGAPGTNGTDGTNGTNGTDGLNALIDMNPEPVGVNCPNGGLRIDVGIDSNGNGSLDPAEITQTGFVCSGTDGSIGWGVATLLETDNVGDAWSPQVSLDATGNAIAVWQQYDGTRHNIWANRYVVGMGWGTAGLIETDNVGSAYAPQVSVDASGNAMAVWRQSDGTRWNIWANRYVVGAGWGTAELIEADNTGNAIKPVVSTDTTGNAVAVWQQFDGTRNNIWANRYVVGAGWGTAGLIETDNVGSANAPQVSVDANGDAVAVWQQSDGTRTNIWANRYVVGTGWGTPQLIEIDNVGDALYPQVSVDASGNAVAVWSQLDGTRSNIWANRYVVGAGWGTAKLIEIDNVGDAWSPQVAVDASGNAVAVWQQSDGTRSNIWANRYVVGTGWGTAQLIETDNAGGALSHQVSVGASGNAVAVWYQSDGTRNNIWANRYVVGAGWGTAGLIETSNESAFEPQVSVDASGNAVAVWHQSDGTRDNIWSNRWQAP